MNDEIGRIYSMRGELIYIENFSKETLRRRPLWGPRYRREAMLK
jgi:hypothetical protein